MDFFDYNFFAQNFLGVQFRSGNWSSFDLWGFQGDSGTPSHRLEQFSDLVPNPLVIRGGCGLRKFLVYTKCYLLPKKNITPPIDCQNFLRGGILRWNAPDPGSYMGDNVECKNQVPYCTTIRAEVLNFSAEPV